MIERAIYTINFVISAVSHPSNFGGGRWKSAPCSAPAYVSEKIPLVAQIINPLLLKKRKRIDPLLWKERKRKLDMNGLSR
jgi:hypothetical protein